MVILIGDMFNSKAQTLINTVNCVGIMGKGIAAEFKRRYPEMFDDYVARCENDPTPKLNHLQRDSDGVFILLKIRTFLIW